MSREDYISIRNASKHFGSVKAVDDITFNIGEGEFFSLLGASGCGKTTLLRIGWRVSNNRRWATSISMASPRPACRPISGR